jgi:hypothetical protein
MKMFNKKKRNDATHFQMECDVLGKLRDDGRITEDTYVLGCHLIAIKAGQKQ